MSRLTAALQLYCRLHNITTRQIEKETKVSQSTVSRFLRGENIESDNYIKLMNWAQQPHEQRPHSAPQKKFPHHDTATTVTIPRPGLSRPPHRRRNTE